MDNTIRNKAHTPNKGYTNIFLLGADVVTLPFVHLIKFCGRLKVSSPKPPIKKHRVAPKRQVVKKLLLQSDPSKNVSIKQYRFNVMRFTSGIFYAAIFMKFIWSSQIELN